jgi:drug/metabolite transporter (DMT)-like permease
MSRKLCVLFLVFGAVCWSLTGMLIKYIPWSSWAVAGWRSLFSAAFLWIAFRTLYPTKWRMDLSASNLAIAVFYSAFTTLFAVSSKLTTSANAILLQYSAPIYVALLGPLILGERAAARDRILILMTLAGLGILLLGPSGVKVPGGNQPLGLAAGAGSGFCWAMSIMLMRRKGAESLPLSCLVLGNLLTVIYSLPAMVPVAGAPDFGRHLFFAALLGIGPLGLGYVFWVAALDKVTALEAALIPSIEPLLNPVWTFMVIGEAPGRWTVVGGAIVLLAVALKAWGALRTGAPEASAGPKEAAELAEPPGRGGQAGRGGQGRSRPGRSRGGRRDSERAR